jgi:hypothetical protein
MQCRFALLIAVVGLGLAAARASNTPTTLSDGYDWSTPLAVQHSLGLAYLRCDFHAYAAAHDTPTRDGRLVLKAEIEEMVARSEMEAALRARFGPVPETPRDPDQVEWVTDIQGDEAWVHLPVVPANVGVHYVRINGRWKYRPDPIPDPAQAIRGHRAMADEIRAITDGIRSGRYKTRDEASGVYFGLSMRC